MRDDHNASEEMIRATFTAPNLIGEGDEDPLLERARALVDEDFPTREERAERAGKTRPKK
jgi:hypothetical protein